MAPRHCVMLLLMSTSTCGQTLVVSQNTNANTPHHCEPPINWQPIQLQNPPFQSSVAWDLVVLCGEWPAALWSWTFLPPPTVKRVSLFTTAVVASHPIPYLVVELGQLEHISHGLLVILAVFVVIFQCQPKVPRSLVKVQQHLK